MPLLRHRTRGVRAVLPLLVLLWAPSAQADPPEGDLLFSFVGEDRIYALEGDEDCEEVTVDGEPAERCLGFDLLVDARGRYEGTVTLSFDGGSFGGELVGEVKGVQKRRRNGTTIDLRSRGLRGNWDPGPLFDDVRAKAKLRCRGEISPTGVLEALCQYVLKRPGSGTDQGEIPLPADVFGGDWELALENLNTRSNDSVDGNANDSLGFIYGARGKYKDNKDESKLKLKGPGGTRSRGAKVVLKKLETPGGAEATAEARYKLLGAKGRATVFSDEDE